MELKTSKKPLRPKNIYYKFCIQDFVKADKTVWLIINLKTDAVCIYGKCEKSIKSKFRKRYPSEKILTVKKIT